MLCRNDGVSEHSGFAIKAYCFLSYNYIAGMLVHFSEVNNSDSHRSQELASFQTYSTVSNVNEQLACVKFMCA